MTMTTFGVFVLAALLLKEALGFTTVGSGTRASVRKKRLERLFVIVGYWSSQNCRLISHCVRSSDTA
jgi:hypothetical protein